MTKANDLNAVLQKSEVADPGSMPKILPSPGLILTQANLMHSSSLGSTLQISRLLLPCLIQEQILYFQENL